MSAVSTVKSEATRCFNSRNAAINDHPSILTDIFQENINIAIWERDLSTDIKSCVDKFLQSHSDYQSSLIVKPDTVYNKLIESENALINAQAFCKDISELVEMFCVLFDLERVGLRLTVLDNAMCPRFHTDRVPCRLVSTYHGVASEWLAHNLVDRSKLGRGNNGQPDADSGLFQSEEDIKHIATISANNDEIIGTLIAKAVDCAGKDCTGYESWVGDGYCDDGAWGVDFTCYAEEESDCPVAYPDLDCQE